MGDQNFYRYVFNNPVNLTDPNGEFAFVLAAPAIGAAAVAAFDFALGFGLGTAAINAAQQAFAAEHTKNPNPANLPKHEKGEARKKKDKGDEKGDARRRGNPNKRKPCP